MVNDRGRPMGRWLVDWDSYERENFGVHWCVACARQFAIVCMVYANPTIESGNADHKVRAECALLEPFPLCRGCVRWAQYRMLEDKSAAWRMRDPIEPPNPYTYVIKEGTDP